MMEEYQKEALAILVVCTLLVGFSLYGILGWFKEAPVVVRAEEPVMAFVSGTEYNLGDAGQVIVEARYLSNGTSAIKQVQFPVPSSAWATDQINGLATAAFDGLYSGLGWKTSQTPATLFFNFTRPQKILSYNISQGAPFANFLGKWEIYGSNNMVSWTLVDNQTISVCYQAGWNATYNVTNPQTFQFYKLEASNMSSVNYFGCPGITFQTYIHVHILEMTFLAESNCNFKIWYPDKTVFFSGKGNTSVSGSEYVQFVVPNVTGVYEYQASCELNNGNTGVISKSFHVSEFQNETSVKLNRIRAVIPK